MQNIISEALAEVLTAQWNHEITNSHIYLGMMTFLKGKGLENIAKLFEHQYEEEQSHAKMIVDFLTDVGAPFFPPSIPACNTKFNGIDDLARLYLDRELLTTKSLNEIKIMAIEEESPVLEEFLRKMISMQQVEYGEATTFLDKAEVIGADWKFAVIFDAGLA